MPARFIVDDVFDGLATLADGTVDLVVTSPPFLALRSYLPADHPDKGKEIGSEATPAAFLDVLLRVSAELLRVLAPHGSIAIELGDTYAGSGGAGGDYDEDGLRAGQPKFRQPRIQAASEKNTVDGGGSFGMADRNGAPGGNGWPLAKSKTLIPELYRIALAYGINPLTGQPSPAGRWRVRNNVTWCRPNPPVGALGDKWRPATSDVVIACTSDKRYWDDIATRRPVSNAEWKKAGQMSGESYQGVDENGYRHGRIRKPDPAGAPLLDYWEIPPGGYPGSHYAVFPPALVEPLIKAMAPPKVCRTCGEPSRRITQPSEEYAKNFRSGEGSMYSTKDVEPKARFGARKMEGTNSASYETLGFTDCGHDDWRPALILDPFAGSGTTLSVATGHGHDAIGIDLDERNADLAEQRIGPFLFERVNSADAGRAIQGLGRVHTGEQ